MIMKPTAFLKIACLATIMAMAACKSSKTVVQEKPVAEEPADRQEFMQKVSGNVQNIKFITARIKFSVQMGAQDLNLTGNLRMKRDDVIRLQLMAFGFVEAGRLEFTKDYVLIMDRINKQYLKVPYEQLSFLRNSGINFYSLQAMFWNELFMPGTTKLSDDDLKKFDTVTDGNDMIISYERSPLSYKWLAGKDNGNIKMVNVLYKSPLRKTQLNWDYTEFDVLGSRRFPTNNSIIFNTGDKEIKIGMKLNYIGNDEDWETRTEVSSKYKQVMVDEILRRFMAL
ncbi:MAG: DUF4292 domain-containing protein [Prevotella sp.]